MNYRPPPAPVKKMSQEEYEQKVLLGTDLLPRPTLEPEQEEIDVSGPDFGQDYVNQ